MSIKSYLLNSRSHVFTLVKATHSLVEAQDKNFNDELSRQAIYSRKEYIGRNGFGELPMQVTHRALKRINDELLYARAAMPSKKNHHPQPLAPCDENCTTPLQFGVPCRHTIYKRLKKKKELKLGDIGQFWHLQLRLDENDYCLRLRDPRVAGRGRGRPKNSLNKSTENLKVTKKTIQKKASRKKKKPGPPKGSAPRLQPNIRRNLSHFEIDDNEAGSEAGSEAPAPPARKRAIAKKKASPAIGRKRKSAALEMPLTDTEDEAIVEAVRSRKAAGEASAAPAEASTTQSRSELRLGTVKRRRLLSLEKGKKKQPAGEKTTQTRSLSPSRAGMTRSGRVPRPSAKARENAGI
ncbi:hypothetical protein B0T17DRAFT_321162 [Bombardia bombarda]|uniref:Uncharacterized protein n=1 Tax=Bombardia bombarda TaxID=252184 RepID=A0AA40BYA3_9PEZI|nr:hypothetical protein B0T17DRAFT_321162 [Bombardia bombarda]